MSSARAATWRALVALEKGNVQRLEPAFGRRAGLSRQDRGLALELARGVERHRLLLDAILDALVDRSPPRDPHLRTALRMGAYQLLWMTRVPAYAAVAETVSLVRSNRGFANAVLRRLAGLIVDRAADPAQPRRELALSAAPPRALVLPRDVLPDPQRNHAAYHALLGSLPVFLIERWTEAHGAEVAARLAAASTVVPDLVLRSHPLRGDAGELRERLAAEGVETEPLGGPGEPHPLLLRWTGGQNPFDSQAFAAGWFVAQDATALRAAEALGAMPGEVVVDLCAGPGTKATVLAAAVQPGGMVHAYDVSAARRRPILENAERLGLGDTLRVHDDLAALPLADRVLVDVPCSNTGVLARRIEVRRRLRAEDLPALVELQVELLRRALHLGRPGGTVVYSTCSIEPAENLGVVERVLAGGPHELVASELALPEPGLHDGGFWARIALH